MNEPFSFGTPERRRFAMQFGYDTRPSFWQNVQSNSHLVIAGVGTAALLGVAAVALWLALPVNEKQAIASAAQAVPAIPVKTTKVAPAAAGTTVAVAAAPQAARKADAVAPVTVARAAAIPALASNNPRWTAADGGNAPAQTSQTQASQAQASQAQTSQAQTSQVAASTTEEKPSDPAFAEPAAETDASDALSKVVAPTPATGQADAKKPDDGAQTAAIPEATPQVPGDQPAADDTAQQAKPKTQKVSAAANGRILRPVTMRTGPKKGAAAIATVPARASVQVLNCKHWCEIVYNGKHGWVYKSYVKPGA